MKTLLTSLVIATSFVGFSQNYQPFNETSSKRFFSTNDPMDNDYFFHSTDSNISGDTLLLDQYYALRDNGNFNDIPECSFWGGASGIEIDTTWLGNQLKWNQLTRELMLRNEQNAPLTFNFATGLGNTSTFYSDGSIEYRIEHTSNTEETFYGVTDSIQLFTIQAYDNVGTPILSDLNNFVIKLSKNYGLISFINCYRFPNVEKSVELEGQTNPTIGHYQLTYDECYPWEPGDVVQFSTNNSYANPPTNKIAYETFTTTDRIETADSVKIILTNVVQEANPAMVIPPFVLSSSPTPSISFKKGSLISEKPWNMSQLDSKLSRANENSTDWCGLKSSFNVDEEWSSYCDSCKCYGSYDGFGQSVTHSQYVKSLGRYRISIQDYGYPFNGGSRTAQVIYSNINGVECGTFWSNIDEIDAFNLELFPNPSNDLVTIKSEFLIESISIRDFSGRIVRELSNIHQKETTLSIVDIQNGAYIIEVKANNSVQKRTIFKQ